MPWASRCSFIAEAVYTSCLLGRGARVDDRDCLENSCTLRGTVGSNPTLSAPRVKGGILAGELANPGSPVA